MRKYVIIMAIVGLWVSPMKAQVQDVRQPIDFETSYIDPTLGMENQLPRTPNVIPTVYTDGFSLFFASPCDGYILYITDTEGDVCYETVVPYGAEELALPEYLSGEYEIILSNGTYDFVGSILLTN